MTIFSLCLIKNNLMSRNYLMHFLILFFPPEASSDDLGIKTSDELNIAPTVS